MKGMNRGGTEMEASQTLVREQDQGIQREMNPVRVLLNPKMLTK